MIHITQKRYLRTEINLSYYKRGDDFFHCLVRNDSNEIDNVESLKKHQNMLQGVVNHLEKIIHIIEKYPEAEPWKWTSGYSVYLRAKKEK